MLYTARDATEEKDKRSLNLFPIFQRVNAWRDSVKL
jgi:hypothetical protein